MALEFVMIFFILQKRPESSIPPATKPKIGHDPESVCCATHTHVW